VAGSAGWPGPPGFVRAWCRAAWPNRRPGGPLGRDHPQAAPSAVRRAVDLREGTSRPSQSFYGGVDGALSLLAYGGWLRAEVGVDGLGWQREDAFGLRGEVQERVQSAGSRGGDHGPRHLPAPRSWSWTTPSGHQMFTGYGFTAHFTPAAGGRTVVRIETFSHRRTRPPPCSTRWSCGADSAASWASSSPGCVLSPSGAIPSPGSRPLADPQAKARSSRVMFPPRGRPVPAGPATGCRGCQCRP
jgi:hypothetical protein